VSAYPIVVVLLLEDFLPTLV